MCGTHAVADPNVAPEFERAVMVYELARSVVVLAVAIDIRPSDHLAVQIAICSCRSSTPPWPSLRRMRRHISGCGPNIGLDEELAPPVGVWDGLAGPALDDRRLRCHNCSYQRTPLYLIASCAAAAGTTALAASAMPINMAAMSFFMRFLTRGGP